MEFSKKDELLIAALQDGLPLDFHPFAQAAAASGYSESEVVEKLKGWKSEKAVRRVGAFLNHYKTGLSSNAMVAWIVPADKVESFGMHCAAQPFITHCYERVTHPDWPYNIYTMIHASSKDEIFSFVDALSAATGEKNKSILFSEKEHKKSVTRLFAEVEL